MIVIPKYIFTVRNLDVTITSIPENNGDNKINLVVYDIILLRMYNH